MLKKIKDLTDQEIHEYVYQHPYTDNCVFYPSRSVVASSSPDGKALNITYDSCTYCQNNSNRVCSTECQTDPSLIDFTAIRSGIYKDDEVEISDPADDEKLQEL